MIVCVLLATSSLFSILAFVFIQAMHKHRVYICPFCALRFVDRCTKNLLVNSAFSSVLYIISKPRALESAAQKEEVFLLPFSFVCQYRKGGNF